MLTIKGFKFKEDYVPAMIKYHYQWIALIGILWGVFVLGGCSDFKGPQKEAYLIRVGESVMTVKDFKQAFELAKIAYPHDSEQDAASSEKIHLQLLKQMTERMIIMERARELGIKISDSEINAAVADIKSDYPEGEFEKTLLESAIHYDSWKQELKIRLLMEKVVAAELDKAIEITSEDIASYRAEGEGKDETASDGTGTADGDEEAMVKNVYRKKTETAYQSWLRKLQEKYTIEINKAEWTKIIEK